MSFAIFDLDGTLLDGDCTVHWLLGRFKRSPLRLAAAFVSLPAATLLISSATRKRAASIFLWIASVGMSEAELHASLAEFAARLHAGQLWLRWRADGLQTFEQHLAAGHRVVIATAAPAWLAQALFAPWSERMSVVGSSLQRRAGGYVCARHCYGEQKIRALGEGGYPARWQYAYTDSLADTPLLRGAERGFVINAGERMLKRVRAAGLGEALRW